MEIGLIKFLSLAIALEILKGSWEHHPPPMGVGFRERELERGLGGRDKTFEIARPEAAAKRRWNLGLDRLLFSVCFLVS